MYTKLCLQFKHSTCYQDGDILVDQWLHFIPQMNILKISFSSKYGHIFLDVDYSPINIIRIIVHHKCLLRLNFGNLS